MSGRPPWAGAAIGLLAGGLTLTAVLATGLATPAAAAEPLPRLAQSGRWLVDPQGRVAQLRGGNVTLPSFADAGEARWSSQTPARMAEQGFNGVRLVVFFSEIMPSPGRIDTAYLDRIARTVDAYKAAGIYTLIDFHQDEYGPLVGVRGLPDWAVFTDGHARDRTLNFPIGYFEDPAVQHAFDNFWRNHPVAGTGKGVQDLYIEALAAVARRFADEPAVVGLDVMNEPATGSRCAKPDPQSAHCPDLERELLAPFYARAAEAIAQAAPRTIIFVEPFMLQGALGAPLDTPVAGPAGRRGLSFHNYGPVEATRDRVNDDAAGVAERRKAAIINTEWGFSNDPAEVAGQAGDFDDRLIPWLAWTRGAFEALVDPDLPNRGNGDRIALLRAYARPYPALVAGVPETLKFDGEQGVLTVRYRTQGVNGRAFRAGGVTRLRLPTIQYPRGYTVEIEGGRVISAANAPVLDLKAEQGRPTVSVTIRRVGRLEPRPAASEGVDTAALAGLPPIPDRPLDRAALLGHIVATPGGREVLDRHVPGLLKGLSHVPAWPTMTLLGLQKFAPSTLDEAKLSAIDADLAGLKVTPGPVGAAGPKFTLDSLTSDLLADPRARAVLAREAPGLADAPQQSLFPQTRLRDLKPILPKILTDQVLARIQAALVALP